MVRPLAGRRAPSAGFDSWDAELAETLDSLDDATNYAGWIFDLVEPRLGDEVLEVGAGHGTHTEALARRSKRVVATDISPRCIGFLRERFDGEPRVEVLQGSVHEAAGSGPFDTVVLVNVLEHIEDDDDTLHDVLHLLKPGGRIVLWVPAFQLLYSDFDRRIGHCRRYRKEGLQGQLLERGFEVCELRYVNAVGAIGWLILSRMLRMTPTTGRPARLFDKYFVPILRAIEGRFEPPFGQSLFAVGVRPVPAAEDS